MKISNFQFDSMNEQSFYKFHLKSSRRIDEFFFEIWWNSIQFQFFSDFFLNFRKPSSTLCFVLNSFEDVLWSIVVVVWQREIWRTIKNKQNRFYLDVVISLHSIWFDFFQISANESISTDSMRPPAEAAAPPLFRPLFAYFSLIPSTIGFVSWFAPTIERAQIVQ